MWRNEFEEKKMNSLEGKVALVTGAAIAELGYL
jgi:hypothetical protein